MPVRFGWIAGFFVAAAVLLLTMVLALQTLAPGEDGRPLVGILIALVVLIAAFVPFLNRAMGRAFVHPPAPGAVPVPEAQLRALADRGAPLELTEQGGRMRLHWRYRDATLRGRMEAHRLTSTHELQIRLGPARRQAILTDIRRSLRMVAGASGVKLGAGFARGCLVGVEMRAGHDIGADLAPREAHAFRYDPAVQKRPVLHTLAEAGWTARFGLR